MKKFLKISIRVLLYYSIIKYSVLIILNVNLNMSPTINFNAINITINA